MISIGPSGERGPTGDHGQHGDRGLTGDTGDTGETGARGVPGVRGPQGVRGRSLTWTKALIMFLMIVLIGVSLGIGLERQQQRLEDQQVLILRNTAALQRANVDRCYGGVEYVKRMNAQYEALAEIERELLNAPAATPVAKRIARKRIKVYEGLMTTLPPEPICPPR